MWWKNKTIKVPEQVSPDSPSMSSLPVLHTPSSEVQSKMIWFHGSWTAKSNSTDNSQLLYLSALAKSQKEV